ncbi:hypothetical protein [Enterococcus sp. AZ091]|uniref:hypothetical protein n=1 Tax=Enterococcus sp. AZ091 TaxID=2774720 RepID=UPI003F6901FE
MSERPEYKDMKITLEIYSHVMPRKVKKTATKFANFSDFLIVSQTTNASTYF